MRRGTRGSPRRIQRVRIARFDEIDLPVPIDVKGGPMGLPLGERWWMVAFRAHGPGNRLRRKTASRVEMHIPMRVCGPSPRRRFRDMTTSQPDTRENEVGPTIPIDIEERVVAIGNGMDRGALGLENLGLRRDSPVQRRRRKPRTRAQIHLPMRRGTRGSPRRIQRVRIARFDEIDLPVPIDVKGGPMGLPLGERWWMVAFRAHGPGNRLRRKTASRVEMHIPMRVCGPSPRRRFRDMTTSQPDTRENEVGPTIPIDIEERVVAIGNGMDRGALGLENLGLRRDSPVQRRRRKM